MRPPPFCIVFLSMLMTIGISPASAETQQPDCNRTTFRAVIDVGHTAESPGAISAHGRREYDFNLYLAQQIERRLIESGFDKTVLLVTGGAAQPALIERVAHANKISADLFLSIHHDSVPNKLMDAWDDSGTPRRFNDNFRGHSIFVSYENRDRAGSLQFAKFLGGAMKEQRLLYTPHYTEKFMGRRRRVLLDKAAGVYRYDKLYVLRATRMPAALLEAGMIVNRDEELLLSMPGRQELIVSAVADAVDRFCAARQAAEAARRKPAKTRTAQPRH
jgi:N-acetylmuramoyl-L-alanine amidase